MAGHRAESREVSYEEDFRFPTLERLRQAYWNPDEPRILTDRVLGVGWAINFYSLLQGLSGLIARGRSVIKEGL